MSARKWPQADTSINIHTDASAIANEHNTAMGR